MSWLFESWAVVGRTLAVAALMYAGAVAILRVSGKRTLAKWNAFDSVVTVAMGSSVATAILSGQTSVAQGLTGFAALVGLQFVIAWSKVRSRRITALVGSEPRLLVRDGKIDEHALRGERVAMTELRAALRNAGIAELDDVGAVVLETDGSISVVHREAIRGEAWALDELDPIEEGSRGEA